MISLQNQPEGSPSVRTQAVNQPPASRVVSKPVPQSQSRDPRSYQVDQLKRRFSPKVSITPDGATSLLFKLAPSDPDFPYELAHLECDLHVPLAYPKERPVLHVRNKDIPRGFSVNIERGWEKLANESRNATLLSLTNSLDRNLEKFLSEQKVETVKLVSFRDTPTPEPATAGSVSKSVKPQPPKQEAPVQQYVPEVSYTKEQIADARAKRAQEVRQLEARMGKLPAFRRSADGVVFTLPVEPKRRSELPTGLQSLKSVHLIVPLLYPLQDIRIQLNEAEPEDADPVEDIFAEKARDQKQMSLMSHLNYFTQNLFAMAKQAQSRKQAEAANVPQSTSAPPQDDTTRGQQLAGTQATEKGHIRIVPPEWIRGGHEESSSDEDYTESDDSDDGGGATVDEAEQQTSAPVDTPERGTMITFPSIELHGIEVLQVSALSITVKCDRCKTVNEFAGLRPNVEKTSSCKKCAISLAAQFRPQMVHHHSTRAGFIDLFGCKVADLLPSTFTPTCDKCSTPTNQGLVSVRGESVTNVCRECHAKFTFKIPDVKFLFITPGSLAAPRTSGPKAKKEKLGLHAGEPLPERGACKHYRKSFRWFRFSCCARVHACDKCHDAAEDHVHEWANRMLCGWCSREQNYAVEACGFCGRSVIGKKGRGFWEGGKGTRDKTAMSRKDPRKYKRTGLGQTSKQSFKGKSVAI